MTPPSRPPFMSSAERRAKKNAKSRARDAAYRQRIQHIRNKPEEKWTEDEKKEVEVFTQRRQLKNQRSAKRMQKQKDEVDRIKAKPMPERTVEEANFLLTQIERKARKNQGDKHRRKRGMYKEGEVPEEYTLTPLTRKRHGTITMYRNNDRFQDLLLNSSAFEKHFNGDDHLHEDVVEGMAPSTSSLTDTMTGGDLLFVPNLFPSQLLDEEVAVVGNLTPPSLLVTEYTEENDFTPEMPAVYPTGFMTGFTAPSMQVNQASLLQNPSVSSQPPFATPMSLDLIAEQNLQHLSQSVNPSHFILPLQQLVWNKAVLVPHPDNLSDDILDEMSSAILDMKDGRSSSWAEPSLCFENLNCSVAVPSPSPIARELWGTTTATFGLQNPNEYYPRGCNIHPFPSSQQSHIPCSSSIDMERR